VLEKARRVFPPLDERNHMATESYESEGVAERRAQKVLTEKVGVTLLRRSKASSFKWSTWKWRFGLRGQTPPD
jgi:hypothetical protein